MAPKLQITSNNIVFSFSLWSLRTQGFKKFSSFRIELLLPQPLANSFLGGWDGFFKSWLTTVFGLFALQVCCTWYVGMCLHNGYSRASIIPGFILFCCCVLVRIFLIAFLSLKCWLEDKLRYNLFITWPPNRPQIPHHCQFVVYLFSFRSNQFIYLKKMRGLCLMSLNWCRFHHVHVLFETNGVSFILSCLFQ